MRKTFLLALLLTIAFLATTKWAQGQTPAFDISEWTSNGCGQQDWQVTDDILSATAYSCGLYRTASYLDPTQPITLTFEARCWPASEHDNAWCGGKIIADTEWGADDDPFCNYTFVGYNHNVQYPANQRGNPYARNGYVSTINCANYYHGGEAVGQWASYKVDWQPKSQTAITVYGLARTYVNGSLKAFKDNVPMSKLGNTTVKLEIVATDHGGPGLGELATAEFRNVSFSVGSTPTPTPTPVPWWCILWPWLCG